jgi:hypothetical protein
MANLNSARSMQTMTKVGYQQWNLTDHYTDGFLYRILNQTGDGS